MSHFRVALAFDKNTLFTTQSIKVLATTKRKYTDAMKHIMLILPFFQFLSQFLCKNWTDCPYIILISKPFYGGKLMAFSSIIGFDCCCCLAVMIMTIHFEGIAVTIARYTFPWHRLTRNTTVKRQLKLMNWGHISHKFHLPVNQTLAQPQRRVKQNAIKTMNSIMNSIIFPLRNQPLYGSETKRYLLKKDAI